MKNFLSYLKETYIQWACIAFAIGVAIIVENWHLKYLLIAIGSMIIFFILGIWGYLPEFWKEKKIKDQFQEIIKFISYAIFFLSWAVLELTDSLLYSGIILTIVISGIFTVLGIVSKRKFDYFQYRKIFYSFWFLGYFFCVWFLPFMYVVSQESDKREAIEKAEFEMLRQGVVKQVWAEKVSGGGGSPFVYTYYVKFESDTIFPVAASLIQAFPLYRGDTVLYKMELESKQIMYFEVK